MEAGFYLRCNVYKAAAGGDVEPEFFSVGFHNNVLYDGFLYGCIMTEVVLSVTCSFTVFHTGGKYFLSLDI